MNKPKAFGHIDEWDVNPTLDVLDLLNPPEWHAQAACLDSDPELFYPHPDAHHITAKALAVCARCPVTRQCLQAAIAHREMFGIWGGTTPAQRRPKAA